MCRPVVEGDKDWTVDWLWSEACSHKKVQTNFVTYYSLWKKISGEELLNINGKTLKYIYLFVTLQHEV